MSSRFTSWLPPYGFGGNRPWAQRDRAWRVHGPQRRRGAAAAELAVLLPVLVTLVLGSIDFGRFAHSYIAVTNAARAGAAFASFNRYTSNTQSDWQSGVQDAVTDEIGQLSGFDSSKLGVTVTTTTESDGLRRVSVTVSYPFNTLVTWGYIPASTTLQRTVAIRCIR
jgi:Flp pilus assembly protein TadG